MINENAKEVVNKLQHIIDRFVKVKSYSEARKIIGETHYIEKLSNGDNVTFFNEIVSEKSIHLITVIKETDKNGQIADFNNFVLVEHSPTKATECYIDRENNMLFFHSSQVGCKISVTYYSVGIGMLSSALIYTHFDSNNKVVETLQEMTKRCQLELDRISTISNADQLKIELKSYIDSIVELIKWLPNPQEFIKSLKDLYDSSTILKEELNTKLEEAKLFLDELKTGSNKFVVISPSMWTFVSEEKYSYEYYHNLNTKNLIVNTTEVVGSVEKNSVVDYEKISDNKIVFYSENNTTTIKAIISASYYPGILGSADVGVITADNLADGTEKVAMRVEERASLRTAQEDIVKLKKDLESSNTKITEMNNKITVLNQGMTELNSKIEELVQEINALKSSLGE